MTWPFLRPIGRAALVAAFIAIIGPPLQGRQNHWIPGRQVTEADLYRWVTEFSNWGKWGPDDGKGQANYITPAKRVQAAGLVKLGITVSMGHNVLLSTDAGATGSVMTRTMTVIGPTNTQDQYAYTGSYHGNNHSHWDALCHYYGLPLGGKFYNNNDVLLQTDPVLGCLKADIMAHKNGVLTRGILFDATAYMGTDFLPQSTAI